jgi:hypothetical protein
MVLNTAVMEDILLHVWISACYWPIVTGKSSRKMSVLSQCYFSPPGKHSKVRFFSFDHDICYLLCRPGLQSLDLDHISLCYALKMFVD